MVGPEPRESAAPLGRQKGHMVDMHDPGEPRAIMTKENSKKDQWCPGAKSNPLSKLLNLRNKIGVSPKPSGRFGKSAKGRGANLAIAASANFRCSTPFV